MPIIKKLPKLLRQLPYSKGVAFLCAKRIRKGAKVAQINLEEAKEKLLKLKL
ncbi:hypothetical protein PMEGAS67_13260 [Priestia megaterium]